MDEPLICVVASGLNFASGVSLCLAEAKGRKCHILVLCYWNVLDIAKTVVLFERQAAKEFSTLKLTYLCPTRSDTDYLRSRGVDALHVSPNALLDEKLLKPNVAAKKKYAAVHVASVERFKRHYLAWGVRKIAVVTYDPISRNSMSELSGYKDVGFVNASVEKGIVPIPRTQVQEIISQSHCGLILSAKEGGNYASTEYLLCGIPVVSTPSKGGRDEFFNSVHVKIVAPKPEAVERAVAEWVESVPDPIEIRTAVLLKMKEHRQRLLEWIGTISGRNHSSDVDENLWSPLFVDKLARDVAIGPEDTIKLWQPFNLRKKFTKFVRLFWKK